MPDSNNVVVPQRQSFETMEQVRLDSTVQTILQQWNVNFKDNVQNISDLPLLDNEVDDFRLVLQNGWVYKWDGASWNVVTISWWGWVQSVVAGQNITVDNTDPLNPIVSSVSGVLFQTNSIDNGSQILLNLIAGTNIGLSNLNGDVTINNTLLPITLQNTVVVSKNWNDSTWTRNRRDLPFLTIQAGINAATAGDTIYVMSWSYSWEININKDIAIVAHGVIITDTITLNTTKSCIWWNLLQIIISSWFNNNTEFARAFNFISGDHVVDAYLIQVNSFTPTTLNWVISANNWPGKLTLNVNKLNYYLWWSWYSNIFWITYDWSSPSSNNLVYVKWATIWKWGSYANPVFHGTWNILLEECNILQWFDDWNLTVSCSWTWKVILKDTSISIEYFIRPLNKDFVIRNTNRYWPNQKILGLWAWIIYSMWTNTFNSAPTIPSLIWTPVVVASFLDYWSIVSS